MTVAASLALWLLAAAPVEQAPPQPPIYAMRDQVRRAAFDPSTYFDDPQFDLIHIAYHGDDYDWPYYAIAIRRNCDHGTKEGCEVRFQARRVKVPVEPSERPRKSGSRFVHKVMQKAERSADLRPVLDQAGLMWEETDLKACPNAIKVLAEASGLEWVRKTTVAPVKGDEIRIALHADKITVAFNDYLQEATYYGALYEGTPAAWVDKLAQTLEPCWKPATAPPPWRK